MHLKSAHTVILSVTLCFFLWGCAAIIFPQPGSPVLKQSVFATEDRDSTITVDHEPWNLFLELYATKDRYDIVRVKYGDVVAEQHEELAKYLDKLSMIDTATLNRSEQLAYWVNLYNASVVKLILDHYPIRSIMDIQTTFLGTSPFNMPVVKVRGRKYSLNYVKDHIIRPLWALEPRVHYLLCDGAVSSPNLALEAYTAKDLDKTLVNAAAQYVNHFKGLTITKDRHVVASRLYEWYEDDFGRSPERAFHHIYVYSREKQRDRLEIYEEIDAYRYNWLLNDAKFANDTTPETYLNQGKYNP